MKGQHSPGPWHRNIPPATKYVTVYRGRNTHICDVIPSRGISPEEAEANLNMIIAGPELLGAAEALLSDWDSPTLSDSTPIAEKFDALRSAVAKARAE